MSSEDLKKAAAVAAIAYVEPDTVIGVGTGSTANHFIDALGAMRNPVRGAVASSEASAERLKTNGVEVLDLNATGSLALYVDGADESDGQLHLIKGGGGALTREKVVASASQLFVCIADDSKLVETLGAFPLPIEVIPMARSFVAREMVILGGDPEYREEFVTDNGNIILDIHNLDILDPVAMEKNINQIPGVVTVGLFAQRSADVLILSTDNGIQTIKAQSA